jgi:hypothetical protein
MIKLEWVILLTISNNITNFPWEIPWGNFFGVGGWGEGTPPTPPSENPSKWRANSDFPGDWHEICFWKNLYESIDQESAAR